MLASGREWISFGTKSTTTKQKSLLPQSTRISTIHTRSWSSGKRRKKTLKRRMAIMKLAREFIWKAITVLKMKKLKIGQTGKQQFVFRSFEVHLTFVALARELDEPKWYFTRTRCFISHAHFPTHFTTLHKSKEMAAIVQQTILTKWNHHWKNNVHKMNWMNFRASFASVIFFEMRAYQPWPSFFAIHTSTSFHDDFSNSLSIVTDNVKFSKIGLFSPTAGKKNVDSIFFNRYHNTTGRCQQRKSFQKHTDIKSDMGNENSDTNIGRKCWMTRDGKLYIFVIRFLIRNFEDELKKFCHGSHIA